MLQEHQLYAKFSKCDFYKPHIKYLGHIIFETGIAVDSKKIKAIKDWPSPTSVNDIRSFLGLAEYYRNFIGNFLRIACPVTTLQKKENKFLWTTTCKEIFQNIKHLLTIASILQIAYPDGDFVFCMDASKEGFGGVLLHNDPAICYESQNLKEHEKNYPMFDLALAAIIHALKMWRHYLMGRKFLPMR